MPSSAGPWSPRWSAPIGRASVRRAGAAAVLGSLSPDVDSVLMPVGWDIYLRVHEIGTHSILGAMMVGAAAAALVRLFARRARYRALAAAAVIGAFSHLLFDVLSGARLHLAGPSPTQESRFRSWRWPIPG